MRIDAEFAEERRFVEGGYARINTQYFTAENAKEF
jgi:hypothetical protein